MKKKQSMKTINHIRQCCLSLLLALCSMLGGSILFTSCQEDVLAGDADGAAGNITISKLNISIQGIGDSAADTRGNEEEADGNGYLNGVKVKFVANDVLHIRAQTDSKDYYSTATFSEDGVTWTLDPAIVLEKTANYMEVFYDGEDAEYKAGDAYEAAVYNAYQPVRIGESDTYKYIDALRASVGQLQNSEESTAAETTAVSAKFGESSPAIAIDDKGNLTIKLSHENALVSINSTGNSKATAVNACLKTVDGKSILVPLSDEQNSGSWQAICGSYNANNKGYDNQPGNDGSYRYLSSFLLTQADGQQTTITVPDNEANPGTPGNGCYLEAGKSYTYTYGDLNLAVPSGYIPIYNRKDLENIGKIDEDQNYVIYTDPSGKALEYRLNANYILMADIDLTPTDNSGNPVLVGDDFNGIESLNGLWTPIGHKYNIGTDKWIFTYFSGRMNGNGHTIKGMTCYNKNKNGFYGLFASIGNAVIYNLHMVNARVKQEMAGREAGILVGKCVSYCNISLCSATNCVVSGTYSTGGLAGAIHSSTTLTRCYAIGCKIMQDGSDQYYNYAGGLVGHVGNSSNCVACYTSGCTVSITGSGSDRYAGGLVGYHESGNLYGCYAADATVSTIKSGSYSGALVGENGSSGKIISCYATNASGQTTGLVGQNTSGTITACVSPIEKNGSSTTGSATGGGSYWGAGYQPLTNNLGSNASLSNVATVHVSTADDATEVASFTKGSSSTIPIFIPKDGIYVEGYTWSAADIWGDITSIGTTAPNIQRSYAGSKP